MIIYHNPVITCEEAAKARQICLYRELKTLLLKLGHKKISVHLKGNNRLNSTAIKKLFKINHLRFLSSSELREYNLSKGLVNPWNIPFCEYNLICFNIFENEYMYTNNGHYDQGIRFAPYDLLNISNVIIGEFSYECKKN